MDCWFPSPAPPLTNLANVWSASGSNTWQSCRDAHNSYLCSWRVCPNLCVGPISGSNPLLGFRKSGHLSSKGKPVREFTQRLRFLWRESQSLGAWRPGTALCSLDHTQGISSPRSYCLKTGCLRCKLLLQSLCGCLMAPVE